MSVSVIFLQVVYGFVFLGVYYAESAFAKFLQNQTAWLQSVYEMSSFKFLICRFHKRRVVIYYTSPACGGRCPKGGRGDNISPLPPNILRIFSTLSRKQEREQFFAKNQKNPSLFSL